MQWWCTSTDQPWNWTWQAYPGIWAAMASLVALYVVAWRRRRPDGGAPHDTRRAVLFGLGVAVLWLATDWPVGALGAGYLASLHMTQYMLYTLVAGPLLLLGIPAWMTPRLHRRAWLRTLCRPLWAGITFNVVLIATHSPIVVDAFRATELGSFGMDALWLGSGLLLWMPLASPDRALRHPSHAVQLVYLFLTAGALPMIPGGFLVFAEYPLYSTYELAPRVHGITAAADQQSAGLIMKVGGIPVVWGVIAVLWFKWALTDKDRYGTIPAVPDSPAELVGDAGDEGPVGVAGPSVVASASDVGVDAVASAPGRRGVQDAPDR